MHGGLDGGRISRGRKRPRPTEAERHLMGQHVAYWSVLATNGTAIVFGPVADPQGGYGVAVIQASDEAAMRELPPRSGDHGQRRLQLRDSSDAAGCPGRAVAAALRLRESPALKASIS